VNNQISKTVPIFDHNFKIVRLNIALALIGMLISQALISQVTFPQNGVWDSRQSHYAFTNAKIFLDADRILDSASLIIKEGKIIAVGKDLKIPGDATIINASGKFIYPAFIDIYSAYGLPETKSGRSFFEDGGQMSSMKQGAFGWNEALRSEYDAYQNFKSDGVKARELAELGFGAVNTHRKDGISRGSSTVVLLRDDRENLLIVKDKAAHHLSFNKGTSKQDYPGSLMGSIALLRQTYMDGDWYKNGGNKEEFNISLNEWNGLLSLPQIFDCGDKLQDLRALKLSKQFSKNYIIKGGVNEYQRVVDLKKAGLTQLIMPLNFPEAYEVEDPYIALNIDLEDLRHWELAPGNPNTMIKNGIAISLTTDGLKKTADFKTKLLAAIKAGLTPKEALKALTSNPANWIGVGDQLGSLDPGKIANFIVCKGDYFTKEGKLIQTWVGGKPMVQQELQTPIAEGKYKLQLGAENLNMTIKMDGSSIKSTIFYSDTLKTEANLSIKKNLVAFNFSPPKNKTETYRLNGSIDGNKLRGSGQAPDGTWITWAAEYLEAGKQEPNKPDTSVLQTILSQITYPWSAWGTTAMPVQNDFLIKNTTVWTNTNKPKLENTDVLIQDGKIAAIGKDLKSSGATVIDGSGKHLTPGIIDEHSHIAIAGGVNECTQANTGEVSIGDVINCDDVNIYRQLSGGVVAAQLLHGSCNPIGGQSALIKLRWGMAPEDMKIQGADGFIKFALGENVKNARSNNNSRFPDTRMGVEQVYEDAFTRAQDYLKAKADKARSFPLRPDLEMETMVEILSSKRFITCHSYVQSEINMLMKVADRYKFRVNTFTHILEGYKVADKMKAHGAGASSFSDWWAYKYEVYDAIPYNGAILHDVGVTTAFNSDDAEMARRLNQEAAKAVKYGNIAPTEALKFVTLNPAKLLHLENKMGSIEKGKDADIVLWSADPLSVYAMAEYTFVDGMKLFDRKEMIAKTLEIESERSRLIQKMINFKKSGGATEKFTSPKQRLYHCDSVGGEECEEN